MTRPYNGVYFKLQNPMNSQNTGNSVLGERYSTENYWKEYDKPQQLTADP